MKKTPSEHPIRRGAAIAAGIVFLFLAVVYTLVSFAPTGYKDFREKRLQQARVIGKRAPNPASRPVSLPPPAPVAGSEAEPVRPRTLDECLTAFQSAIEQAIRDDLQKESIALQGHPLLGWNIVYYRHGVTRVSVTDFDAGRWQECIAREMDMAMPRMEEATTRPADDSTGNIASKNTAEADLAVAMPGMFVSKNPVEVDLAPALRLIARIADAELFDQDIQAGDPDDGTPSPRLTYHLAIDATLPLVRSILLDDSGKIKRQVAILHQLALRDIESMRSGNPTVMDRLEPLVMIAAERGHLDPEGLAVLQQHLEASRLDPAQARLMRTANILAAADSILKDPGSVRPLGNTWNYLLGGRPSAFAARALEPAFHRSVESYSMRLIEGDPGQVEGARAGVNRTLGLMSMELTDPWELRAFENNEFLLDDIAAGQAPYLVNLETTLNQQIDSHIIMLAACRFRMERGSWPEKPADLVPDFASIDYTLHGLQAWRFFQFDCPHCGQRHFVVAVGAYDPRILWEGGNDDQPWEQSRARLQENLKRNPDMFNAVRRINQFCLYEEAFRRVLCPGEEATAP